MREFRDETERAVWAAAFAQGPRPGTDHVMASTSPGREQWADRVLDEYRAAIPRTDPYRAASGPPQLLAVDIATFKKPSPVEWNLRAAVERATNSARGLATFEGQSEDDQRYYEAVYNTLEQLRRQL